MSSLKTKDASERLGVSQTTIKRWASHYPSSFRKTPLGHYVFSQREFALLQYIKGRIEQGATLEQIALPGPPAEEAARDPAPADLYAAEARELQRRISEVERSLEQKADEVVSAQVRQHRTELDELRRSVAQLAAAVETLRSPPPANAALPESEPFRAPALPEEPALPKRKRKLFRTFF